ncbi:unnamed protein product [Diamesa serratosioi]
MAVNVSRKRIFIALFVAIIIIVGIITVYNLGLKRESQQPKVERFTGAVAANGKECAEIGAGILLRGGSVADGAIATMLCEGVTCPQSTGIGGGFLMTIYIKATGKAETLDAREVAPKAATRDMYVGDKNKTSLIGGLSIAVPGEIKGMWELHKKYGILPWKDLFQPTIKLCKEGHEVTPYLARILSDFLGDKIYSAPTISEVFLNPATNRTWKAGDRIKRLALADTMETIANEGVDSIYAMGTVGRQLLDDIKSFGGILTEEDFAEYQVKWLEPAQTTLKHGEKLYTMPLSGCGPLLVFIMNILKDYELKHDSLSYHRIIEAYKFAYARRSELGDPSFVEGVTELVKNLTSIDYAMEIRKRIDDKTTHNELGFYGAHYMNQEDHGTAHISILAPNGDAISVTGTINYILGSMRRSKTGIILNDEMDDFSSPGITNTYGIDPSPSNFIVPGKRPLSSMSPTIITDKNGDVSMIVGSAGGSKITTAIAQTLIQYYYFKTNIPLSDIFGAKRLHHQLLPNQVSYELDFDQKIVDELAARNHTMVKVTQPIGFGALVGIVSENGIISGAYDPRRGGSVAVF